MQTTYVDVKKKIFFQLVIEVCYFLTLSSYSFVINKEKKDLGVFNGCIILMHIMFRSLTKSNSTTIPTLDRGSIYFNIFRIIEEFVIFNDKDDLIIVS